MNYPLAAILGLDAGSFVAFVAGAVVSMGIAVFSSRLALLRDQRKEGWIRRLNSYENFFQYTTQMIDLLRVGVAVPPHVFWDAVVQARKAAYDAQSYDPRHPEPPARMQRITLDLIEVFQAGQQDWTGRLNGLRSEAEDVRSSFYARESQIDPQRRFGRGA